MGSWSNKSGRFRSKNFPIFSANQSSKITSKGLCELLIKIYGQFNIFRNLDFDCRYIGEFFERNRPDLFDQEPIFFPLGSSNIPTPTSARSARVFHGGFYSFTGILFFHMHQLQSHRNDFRKISRVILFFYAHFFRVFQVFSRVLFFHGHNFLFFTGRGFIFMGKKENTAHIPPSGKLQSLIFATGQKWG